MRGECVGRGGNLAVAAQEAGLAGSDGDGTLNPANWVSSRSTRFLESLRELLEESRQQFGYNR